MTATARPAEFAQTKNGSIDAESLDNIRTAFRRADVELAYDAFRREPLVNGKPTDDLTIDRLWVMLEDRFGFRPSKETLRTIVVTEADKVHIHPVRGYLDGLRWDGEDRLDRWLPTYAGAADSDYVRAVGAIPLIAAVRRVRDPGEKFDELLILESTQGTDKSTTLRTLCPDESWFSDDLPLGVDSKQVIERTSGKWILEASELHGNRGHETEAVKAFLSRQVDGPVRLAYGRLPVSVPRQFVLIGTTNANIGYLKDATGGRRFWPVHVQRFDVDAIRRDRDQLWAEAVAREDAGASIRLSDKLWAAAALQQEQRRAADPWEDLLEEVLEGPDKAELDGEKAEVVPVADIWYRLGLEAGYRDNRHADRVAAILQRHGFTTKRKFTPGTGGNAAWHWVRVPSVPSDSPSVLHDIWLELRTSTNLDRLGRFLEQVRGTPLDVAVEERIEQVEGLTTSAKTAEWLREPRPILENVRTLYESMGWRQAGPAPDAKRFEAHLRMLIETLPPIPFGADVVHLSTVLTEYLSTTLHHGVPIPDDYTLTAIFPLPGSKWGKTERVKACRRPGVSSSEYNREGFGEISSGTLVAPEVVLISDTAGNDGNAGYSSTDPL